MIIKCYLYIYFIFIITFKHEIKNTPSQQGEGVCYEFTPPRYYVNKENNRNGQMKKLRPFLVQHCEHGGVLTGHVSSLCQTHCPHTHSSVYQADHY